MIELFSNAAGRFGLNSRETERFIKFLCVGTIGFLLDFGSLAFQVELLHLPEVVSRLTPFSETVGLILANSISFSLAVLSNFTLNRLWTYPESRSKKKRIQLPQFGLVSVIGLLLNNAILAILNSPFHQILASLDGGAAGIDGYMPAKMVATGVVLFWNFFINRRWTYGNVS